MSKESISKEASAVLMEEAELDNIIFSEKPSKWELMDIDEFKQKIDKLTGKEKSQVYFSLLDEIATSERGIVKQKYLRLSIKPRQMKAANETREAFSRLFMRESCIKEKLEAKRRIEDTINFLLTRTIDAAKQAYFFNNVLKEHPTYAENIDLWSSLVLYEDEDAPYKIKLNKEKKCCYLEPAGLWDRLVEAGQAHSACLKSAKSLFYAYIEYCLKYDLIYYLPCSSRKMLNEIRSNNFSNWHLGEKEINYWLKSLEDVNTAEAWSEWLNMPFNKFEYPLLYTFQQLNPKHIDLFIGDKNYFEQF